MLIWGLVLSLASAEEPFWRSKEKVYSRIEDREIVVSVSSTPDPAGHRMRLQGGGQMAAPCSFAFQAARDYESLARASSYVSQVKYQADSGRLDATLGAYGLSADLAFKLSSGDQVIDYVMVQGPLSTLEGKVRFLTPRNKKQSCDIGIDGLYFYKTFPIPDFFLRFGLEVVLQKMAYGIREKVEAQYKAAKEAVP